MPAGALRVDVRQDRLAERKAVSELLVSVSAGEVLGALARARGPGVGAD
jgi:hypothetical protein